MQYNNWERRNRASEARHRAEAWSVVDPAYARHVTWTASVRNLRGSQRDCPGVSRASCAVRDLDSTPTDHTPNPTPLAVPRREDPPRKQIDSTPTHRCVTLVFSIGVVWPIRNASNPAWAIMIPLSMQKDSSVAKTRPPRSDDMMAIISWRRRLPGVELSAENVNVGFGFGCSGPVLSASLRRRGPVLLRLQSMARQPSGRAAFAAKSRHWTNGTRRIGNMTW